MSADGPRGWLKGTADLLDVLVAVVMIVLVSVSMAMVSMLLGVCPGSHFCGYCDVVTICNEEKCNYADHDQGRPTASLYSRLRMILQHDQVTKLPSNSSRHPRGASKYAVADSCCITYAPASH